MWVTKFGALLAGWLVVMARGLYQDTYLLYSSQPKKMFKKKYQRIQLQQAINPKKLQKIAGTITIRAYCQVLVVSGLFCPQLS